MANDDWRARFLKAATPTGGATPKNTLEAMAGIAREPWAAPKELYAIVRRSLSAAEGPDARRSAPFVPYLVYAPGRFRPLAVLSRAAGIMPTAGSCLTRTAISGAA